MSSPFRTLGLGGGGMKGILFVGALLELSKTQDLVFPDGVYGVSVGSIVGAYIAFGLTLDAESLNEAFQISKFVPDLDYAQLPQSLSLKGVFSMDTFEKSIIDLFLSKGVDIRTKKIGDALMPLYIAASNLTKGKPTIFSKDVPLLEALKCSCCIPGVFRPQIMYGQVFVDGDLFVPSIDYFIPTSDHVLCLSLKLKMIENNFEPEKIEDMSPLTYIHDVYTLVTLNFFRQVRKQCTLSLAYPNLRSFSNISDFSIPHILETAGADLRRFLCAKSILQESTKIAD
jgi:predicted acylesterase/phospholipase RssA